MVYAGELAVPGTSHPEEHVDNIGLRRTFVNIGISKTSHGDCHFIFVHVTVCERTTKSLCLMLLIKLIGKSIMSINDGLPPLVCIN